VGHLQPTGRTIGRTRRILPLAPSPVEGCPVGGCVSTIPASTSNRSLRCSCHQLGHPILVHFPKGKSCPKRVNLPLPESARNNPCDFPLLGLFQLRISPRLPFWELTHIPVHGYDVTSGPSPPISGPPGGKRRTNPGPRPVCSHLRPRPPAPGCASAPSNLPPCEGGLCACPPHAPLRRRFRLVRLGGRYHRGGNDVGGQSTARRTLGKARGRAEMLLLLAPCPVEGCPIGRCTRQMKASPSNCSLGFSRPFTGPPTCISVRFGTTSFTEVLATPAPQRPFSRPFQLWTAPLLALLHMTPIPVHGYDRRSRSFPPVAPKGRTRESSHMRHGVRLPGFPHSTAVRWTLTVPFGLTRARRRER